MQMRIIMRMLHYQANATRKEPQPWEIGIGYNFELAKSVYSGEKRRSVRKYIKNTYFFS